MNPGVHLLWPTPLGIFRMDDSQAFHADMLALVHAQMASQCEQRGLVAPPAFFASDDNLAALLRERAEGRRFLAFIADALQTLVGQANQTAWSGQAVAPDLQMTGMWFQCSRDGAFHDVHTHANCSWSAAYIVQIDPEELRVRHPCMALRMA